MARNVTAEEIRAEKIRAMGEALGQLYYDLWNDVAWLHAKWQQYKILYATDPERVKVLNRTAPTFFFFLQKVLVEDVILHIARLTDPPRTFGRENLTLQQLPEAVQTPKLREKVAKLLEAALERAAFAREWRNRRIAHTDLLTLQNRHPEPLPPAALGDIEAALEAIRDAMNHIELEYCDSTVFYEDYIGSDDAETLLAHLKRAIRAFDDDRNRWRRDRTSQALLRRSKRTWLLIALLDAGILLVASIFGFEYFLIALGVVIVSHTIDVAFLLAK